MNLYFTQKLADFTQALRVLDEALRIEHPSLLEQDGMIQRFEFCFELAWKTLKLALEAQGELEVKSPKAALTRGLVQGWIQDEARWLAILRYRNLSTHTYDEALAAELISHLPGFLEAMQALRARLAEEG
jgi:nucleotidyltransferase substrate binding protein (TIGR01987 family)